VTKAVCERQRESCSRNSADLSKLNDGLCDQSIRADRTKVSGQTLGINNSDLKAKKAQADATILQATADTTMPRKMIVL
jgi:hypothetical protein